MPRHEIDKTISIREARLEDLPEASRLTIAFYRCATEVTYPCSLLNADNSGMASDAR